MPVSKYSFRDFRIYLLGALAVFCGFVQFRIIVFVYGADYGRSVDAAHGVVTGHPHWRLYQSRIFGPYLIEALSALFPSYLAAHVFFSIATLVIMSLLVWRLGLRISGNRGGGAFALFFFHFLFSALLSRPWLYAWDYLDAIAFLLFVDFVLCRRPWPWFAGLFAVAIFNRESAQYIALWMVADPLIKWLIARRRGGVGVALDRTMLLVGIICGLAGLVIVEALRRILLVEEMGPKMFTDAIGQPGQLFANQLHTNLGLFVRVFTQFDYGMPFLIVIFLLVVLGLAALMAWRHPARLGGLALAHVALIASFLAFAVLVETRAYIVLIPFVVAATLIALLRPAGPPPADPLRMGAS
jgi:hypothetical protein